VNVSVIIPVRDDPLVFRAVRSVLAQESPGITVEIIVVDNGSKPSFRDSLSRFGPHVTVLDEPLQGAGAARNRGLDAASGDLLFLLDADCYALPGWIAAGVEGMVATGADMLVGDCPPASLTRSQLLVRSTMRRQRKRPPPGDGRPRTILINTANAVIRRQVANRLRFDTRLIRGQDWAFSLAATEAGFTQARWEAMKVRVSPDERLALKVAKETVAGWCMADLRERTGRAGAPRQAPRPRILLAKTRVLILGAWVLDGIAQVVPPRLLAHPARALVTSGRGIGADLFAAGVPLPSPFGLVRGRFQSPVGHAPRPKDTGGGTFGAVR
jgi:glycosyltransferase involved in cell wall biosynthesis